LKVNGKKFDIETELIHAKNEVHAVEDIIGIIFDNFE
jgi:hypothetical protein